MSEHPAVFDADRRTIDPVVRRAAEHIMIEWGDDEPVTSAIAEGLVVGFAITVVMFLVVALILMVAL